MGLHGRDVQKNNDSPDDPEATCCVVKCGVTGIQLIFIHEKFRTVWDTLPRLGEQWGEKAHLKLPIR